MAEAGPRAFVVGHPIGHSRSPLIHGFWLKKYDLPGSYERLDVAPENFARFLSELPETGFVGGNVTIPHKEAAFAAARADESAGAIRAVNTLWLESGALRGSNTDAYGFAANLDESASDWRRMRTATVLGAGGASRAVLFALKAAGFADIRLVNRSRDRAERLAKHFGSGISVWNWDQTEMAFSGADLLVNTTSLGMNETEMPPLELGVLAPGAIVTDIVYTPLRTPLLEMAAERGLRTIDGLGMLLHQAAPGFERWFGKRPLVDNQLREHVLADMGISP